MSKRVFLSVLMALTAPSAASAQQPAQQRTQPVEQVIEPLRDRIDAIFTRFMEQAHVPGLVYGIVADGRLVQVRTMGRRELQGRDIVTPDTLFRIASMSKAFTALAILKLRDEGRLSLDAPAETYVPELRNWRYPSADSPRIRVRDLLNHTAGFVTDDPWGDRQQPISEADFTRMLRDGVPFQRTPGTAFEYSNFGYALLGRIITNVSGRPYDQYIEAEIMRPLGMTATDYDVLNSPAERRALGYRWENDAWAREPDMAHGVFGAMGGVETSARDYARWIAFLLSAWPARDGSEQGPVRRSTVRELANGSNFASARMRPRPGGEPCAMATAYGMGFIAGQDCEFGTVMMHGGGYPGYGSFLLLMPDHGIGIFAMTNRTYAGPAAPLFELAQLLRENGLLRGRQVPVSDRLQAAYRAAGAMYQAGNLGPGRDLLAMNFLMDRSAENWTREFARLKGQAGECRTDVPITATGALSGDFEWQCERGRLQGQVLLAPTERPGIQALRLRIAPNQPAQ